MLIVLVLWEESFFFQRITLQVQIRRESSSFWFGSPTSKWKPTGWCWLHLTPTGTWWSVYNAELDVLFRDTTMGSDCAVSRKGRIVPLMQTTQEFEEFHRI